MALVERGKIYGGSVEADVRASLKRGDYTHFVYEVFDAPPVCFDDAGYGDPTGATGDENRMISAQGNYFEYHILGGGQTILCPSFGASGLDIAFDQGSAEGVEISQGITARSRGAFVVGTAPAFRLRVQASIADVTGAAEFAVGFRKAEAYQANLDDYDELVCLNMLAGDIKIETILNGGTTTTTDTTNNWADAATVALTVEVSAAGVVTYEIDDAAPTTVASFTFDTAEVVIPFVYFLHASDLAGAVPLKQWECGYDRAVG